MKDISAPTKTDRGVSRRGVLVGAGALTGLFVSAGAYVAWSLQGDHGGYVAPASQPMLSIRGQQLDGSDQQLPEQSGEWSFETADELYLFVHGFDTTADAAPNLAYTAERAFEAVRPNPVVGLSWDSDTEWDAAKETADATGTVLTNWLTEWEHTDGRPIHILGYSLGARVVCEALNIAADRNVATPISSVSLLGAAIPRESVTTAGQYHSGIEAVDAPVSNFYSENDRVLGWIYRLSDRSQAVGYQGTGQSETTSGYTDVDVTDLVADHYSYFQPEEGCIPRVVDQFPSQ